MPSALKRYQSDSCYHFITFSCYRRLPLLDSSRVCESFERSLERLRKRHNFYVFGYVLMPEHVHLLLSEPPKMELSKLIGALKTAVARGLRSADGHLWQKRYYDFNVLTQRKFVEKLRYMHRNPVKRGLVEQPEDWPWSSFRHWLTGHQSRIEIESHWTWNRREGLAATTHP
jgi:putative transposase